ncbi:MAG: sel1 repeat family protein [Sulfurospirillum sp.]|nr:sel1 repeat family protein [Sulfurospirillum sp.]
MKILLSYLLSIFTALYAGGMFDTQAGNYEKAINGDSKLADSFCLFYVVFNNGNIMLKDRSYIPVTSTIIYNLCKIGAEGGFPRSQNEFGNILLNEKVPSLKKEAEKYFLLSSKQGNTDAKYNLAQLYSFDKDIKRDYYKAVGYYKEIVDLNKSSVQCSFAILYAEGKGTLRDYKKAKSLVQRGYENARYELEKNFCSSVWSTYSLDSK